MRPRTVEKTTTNRTVLNRIVRRFFHCNHCPANRGENANRQVREDRYKAHRRNALEAFAARYDAALEQFAADYEAQLEQFAAQHDAALEQFAREAQ